MLLAIRCALQKHVLLTLEGCERLWFDCETLTLCWRAVDARFAIRSASESRTVHLRKQGENYDEEIQMIGAYQIICLSMMLRSAELDSINFTLWNMD